MPQRPGRPCNKTGCPAVIHSGRYCDKHQSEAARTQDTRESSSKRGYDRKWRKARLGYLHKHPLCVACEKEGIVKAASVVDHIIPHKGNKQKFWDSSNWQPLCKRHHDIKTATEDGGFGR